MVAPEDTPERIPQVPQWGPRYEGALSILEAKLNEEMEEAILAEVPSPP